MAHTWRERWLESRERQVAIEKRLQDAERSGAPLTFSAEQVIQLFAIAKRSALVRIPQTVGVPLAIGQPENWLLR
jgi:hypothetical protein